MQSTRRYRNNILTYPVPNEVFIFVAHCVSIKQNQCRPGTAYSNLVSARKRARSEEDGVLPRLMTNSSIKEASSNTFVTRSRRIQSAGSAEEEIIRAREGNKSHDKTSLETGYSKPELQLKTFKDKDAEKSNRFKVQQLEKDHRSQRGREEESKEPRRTCIQRKEREPSYILLNNIRKDVLEVLSRNLSSWHVYEADACTAWYQQCHKAPFLVEIAHKEWAIYGNVDIKFYSSRSPVAAGNAIQAHTRFPAVVWSTKPPKVRATHWVSCLTDG